MCDIEKNYTIITFVFENEKVKTNNILFAAKKPFMYYLKWRTILQPKISKFFGEIDIYFNFLAFESGSV